MKEEDARRRDRNPGLVSTRRRRVAAIGRHALAERPKLRRLASGALGKYPHRCANSRRALTALAATRSRRGSKMALKRHRCSRRAFRISQRPMGIAIPPPPIARRRYAWCVQKSGPSIAMAATRAIDRRAGIRSNFRILSHRSQGAVSQSSPTVAAPSLPPAVAEQQQCPTNGTAAGDESSASVSAPMLSRPLPPA